MNKFYSKKLFVFFFLLGLLVVGLVYWREIACHSLNFYLKKMCHDKLAGSFQSHSIYSEDHNWIIEQPKINGHMPLKDGGLHFQAEKIILNVIPHFGTRQIDLSITVVKPNLNIKQTTADAKAIVSELFPTTSFFTVNTKIFVTEGSLHFHDFKNDPPTRQSLYFQIEGENKEGHKGQIRISLDDPLLVNNCVMLSLIHLEKQFMTMDFNFDNVKCSAFVNTMRNFIPSLGLLEVTNGMVSGQMALTIPEEGKSFAQGDLSLHNIEFCSAQLEVKGFIQEAYLHLTENNDFDAQEERIPVPSTKGHLELIKESMLEFQKEGQPYCKITELLGGFYFDKPDIAQVKIEGKCSHHGMISGLNLNGFARFEKGKEGLSLDLLAELTSSENAYAKAKFTTRAIEKRLTYVDIQFEHISSSDFDLLKMVFLPYFPNLHEIQMNKGFIDASAFAFLDGLQMTDLKIEKIIAKGVHFNLAPWNLVLKVGNLAGNLSVNLKAQNTLETLHADLDITDSHLCIFGENSTVCQLSDMQTKLIVRKGVVENSSLKGIFAGLKGDIHLNGTPSTATLMAHFDFKGEAKEIFDILSDPIKDKLKQQFTGDLLVLSGTIQKTLGGIKIEGKLNVKGQNEATEQTIEYGFDLDRVLRVITSEIKNIPLPREIVQEFDLDNAKAKKTLSSYPFLKWLKNELFVNSLDVKNGWFKGQALPLHKYLEPLIFSQNQASISGSGDFQGTFNQHYAVVNFDLLQTSIENKDLNLDIKNLSIHTEKNSDSALPATYYFDIDNEVLYGFIPITNCTYLEKKRGLLFTDLSSTILIKDKQIHLTNMSVACAGMVFNGKMEVDFSCPTKGIFNINIIYNQIKGHFSQLQYIFSHFDSLAFIQKLPIEGDLNIRKKESFLSMNFAPQDFQIKSQIKGSLTKGHSTLSNPQFMLHDLETNFEFDHTAQTLIFNDIQGKISIGKNENLQEFSLAGDQVNFTNLSKKEALFDIWIGDTSRDIFRIAGKTQIKELSDENKVLEFVLDPEFTHFGDIRPTAFDLTLKENNQIHNFNLDLHLKIETILYDLQLAHKIGLIPLPPKIASEIDQMKSTSGEATVRFHYDDRATAWTGHLEGNDISLGNYHFNKFSFHGKKNGAVWAIDQLTLDNLSIAADLVRQQNGWKANFLGLRYGDSLLLGMEGDYNEDLVSFEGRVNLLELNLDKLNEWPKLQEFVLENNPKGFLKGTGTVYAKSKHESSTGWHIDIDLNSTLKSLALRGMHFEDGSNIPCRYISDKSLSLQKVKTFLKDAPSNADLCSLSLKKIAYDFPKNEFAIETLDFSIPPQNITKTTDLIQQAFSKAINYKTAEIIKHLKSNSSLQGHLDFIHSPASTHLQLALKDDTYHFLNKDHETHQLVLKYNLNNLKILTQYQINGHPCWLALQANAPEFSAGLMTLSDHYPDIHHKDQPALHIQWKMHDEQGFLIDRAHGLFGGLYFNLQQNQQKLSNYENLYLQGSVNIDPNQASKLISPAFSTQVAAMELGSGFELRGNWMINKLQNATVGLPFSFQGYLLGQKVMIKGYEFESLQAQVNMDPHNIYIQQFKIEDPSVKISLDQAHIFQMPSKDWFCKIPLIQFNELYPSLLHEPNVLPPKQQSTLVVRSLEVENLYGNLGYLKTFTGKGKLQFLNPPKKNFVNAIFAIPVEILTLLGLNLTVLNPVSGTIFYEIKDSKFYLTKFKDVYSKGKMSKFNLSNSKEPSYVDFDLNLNLRIKMKQYNLFFKLAELFTFNVGGNLKKPTYSLQKHSSKTADK